MKRSSGITGSCERSNRVRAGEGSIVAYEGWLETGETTRCSSRSVRITQDDCESTASLYHWLREKMRARSEAEFDVDFDKSWRSERRRRSTRSRGFPRCVR